MVVRDPIERIVSDWIQVQEKRRSLNLPEWSLKTRLITRRGSINRRYRAVRTSQYYKHYQQWMKLGCTRKMIKRYDLVRI